MITRKKFIHTSLFVLMITAIIFGSFLLSQFVAGDSYVQSLVQTYGGFGVVLISFIAGLNLLVPVPAATFVPIFTAGGMDMFTIITLLVIGAMSANLLAYALGRYGYLMTKSKHLAWQEKFTNLYNRNKKALPFFIFGFSAFIPLPDEVFLVPLGLIGIKLRVIILPLFFGTIVFQTIAAFGFSNVFILLDQFV